MAKTPGYMLDSILDILPAPRKIPWIHFTRSRTMRNTIVADLSVIGAIPFYNYRHNSDAKGIEIVGKMCNVVFEFEISHQDAEGDVLYWTFNVIPEHRERAKGITYLVILND